MPVLLIVIVAAILIGYPVLNMTMKRKSKNCKSCGYKFTADDCQSYRGERKGAMNKSFVYVTLVCPNCGKTEEKCIEVSNLRGIEQGIIDYYNS